MAVTERDPHRSIDAVWRLESTRLIGALVRIVRDVGLAEDLAQDALVAALAQWPASGVPANPGAWLMAVAKRRAIDGFRRDERQDRAYAELGQLPVPVDVESAADHVEEPGEDERAERLSAVLGVLYLLFTEGYAATAGDDWLRPALCEEALRLGRILAGLVPREPEAHGLVALMEIQHSRASSRTGPAGRPVLIQDQDRRRWDRLLVRRGLTALGRAESLTTTPGPYVLQAAIAACHARATTAQETDWPGMVALYAALVAVTGSSVAELNRGIAISRAYGPAAGLAVLDALRDRPELRGYHLLPSARGDLLAQLGRADQAREQFQRAAALTANEAERAMLLRRSAEL